MASTSRLVVSLALAGVFALGGTPNALAAPTDPPSPQDSTSATSEIPAEYAPLLAFWEANQVPAATQQRLFATLKAGGKWDSMVGGSSRIVSTQTRKENGHQLTTYTYKDGSVRVDTVDVPVPNSTAGGVTTQSVGGCTYEGGSYWYNYTDCKASSGIGVATLWFYFDYSGSYSSSSINKYYDIGCTVIAGTCSDKHFTKISSTNVRALADIFQAGSTTTVGMGVKVSGKNASTYNL